jgi:DNA-binding transcriptional MerR regulator
MYTTRFLTVMRRVTASEAAKLLGITPDGVRMRVRRGSIEHEKDESGRLYVYVDEAELDRNETQDPSLDAYLAMLQDQIEQLRNDVADWKEQLREEREANRENRRLLAAALERLPPALEAPQEYPSEAARGPESRLGDEEEPYSTHAPPKPMTPVQRLSERVEEVMDRGNVPPEGPGRQHPVERPSWWRRFFGFE